MEVSQGRHCHFAFSLTAVDIIEGNVVEVEADALIAPINSFGMWMGGMNSAIRDVAGGMFHGQVIEAGMKGPFDTVVAKHRETHRGRFNDVVFVRDDLEKPLREIVAAGLKAANDAGYEKVSMPALRTGVMRGQVERTLEQVANETVIGLKKLTDGSMLPGRELKLRRLIITIFNQSEVYDAFAAEFRRVTNP